ncbi:ATP-grasp domain-containing protein [Streptomyces sp. NPDC001220]
MKNLLLVHFKNENRRRHLQALAGFCIAKDWNLIILMRGATWEHELAHQVIDADTSSEDLTVAALHSWCSTSSEIIDGVFTFVEYAVPLASRIASEWKLPHISHAASRRCRDKFAMRKALAAGGVRQPRFALAADCDEAITIADDIGFPVVVKPVIGAASMWVRRFDSAEELRKDFASLQRYGWEDLKNDPLCHRLREEYGDAVLVEEYIDGYELSYEALVVDGEVHPVAIHRKPLPMTGPYFLEYYYRTPAGLSPELERQVHDQVGRAIGSLGVSLGATHTEVRISGHTVFLVEVGARVGGMGVYQSVYEATGIDMITSAASLAMGEKPDVELRHAGKHVGFCYFFPKRSGYVKEVKGEDLARELNGVVMMDMYCNKGDFVTAPPLAKQGVGLALFTAASTDELDRTYHALQAAIDITVELEVND